MTLAEVVDGHSDVPFAERPAWMSLGACVGCDPELFFPTRGAGEYRDAIAICATCPVRVECLDYAMVNREVFGVWGGLSERQRRKLRAGKARGRKPRLRASCGSNASYSAGCRCDHCKAAHARQSKLNKALLKTRGAG